MTDLDGNPITLQMVDHATQVEISKYNDNEEPLSGAKMQILDSDKNVVEEWVTDGTTHVIRGKLIYGKTYTLHEAAAPPVTTPQRIWNFPWEKTPYPSAWWTMQHGQAF